MAEPARTPPPIICVNDRVLLEYALLDDSVGFRDGHGLVFVDGKEMGKVPCLGICSEKESQQVTLYFCDADWRPVGIAGADSIAKAKIRAERIYPGSSARWIQAHFTGEDVSRHLEESFAGLRCSFCGRRPDETVAATFEGTGNTRICGECIARFYRELSNPPANEPR